MPLDLLDDEDEAPVLEIRTKVPHQVILSDEEDVLDEGEPIFASILDDDDEGGEPVSTQEEAKEDGQTVDLLSLLDEIPDTVLPQRVAKEEFIMSRLPPLDIIRQQKELQAEKGGSTKPFIVIGEYLILRFDRMNIQVLIWGSTKPKRGKNEGKVITKLRPVGFYRSLLGACRAIMRHQEFTIFSLANYRHLTDAITFLERRDQLLLEAVARVTPQSFIDGQVVTESSLLQKPRVVMAEDEMGDLDQAFDDRGRTIFDEVDPVDDGEGITIDADDLAPLAPGEDLDDE